MNNTQQKTTPIVLLGGANIKECIASINRMKAMANDKYSELEACAIINKKVHDSESRGFVVFQDWDDFTTQTNKENLKYIEFSEDISYGKNSVFLFPGNGIHQKNMLSLLCGVNEYFGKRLQEIEQVTKKYYHIGLLDEEKEDEIINQIRVFAAELVIAEFWERCGCRPDYIIGHSMGEYAAACFSGIFTEEAAIYLLIKRSELLSGDSSFQMAAVETTEEVIKNFAEEIGAEFEISGYNAPEILTITAEKTNMMKLEEKCRIEQIQFNLINAQRGGHYSGLKDVADKFYEIAKRVAFSYPQRNMISTVYSNNLDKKINSPLYWAEHIYKPVQFCQAIQSISVDEIGRMIDIGVSPVLLGMAMKNIGNKNIAWIPTIRAGRNYKKQFYRAIGLAHNSGVHILADML